MKYWESICTRCGLCCHSKVKIGKRLWYLDLGSKCAFLSEDSTCSVYPQRFRLCPECRKLTLLRALTAEWLPPQCAYVQWAKRHHIRFSRRCEWVMALDETHIE